MIPTWGTQKKLYYRNPLDLSWRTYFWPQQVLPYVTNSHKSAGTMQLGLVHCAIGNSMGQFGSFKETPRCCGVSNWPSTRQKCVDQGISGQGIVYGIMVLVYCNESNGYVKQSIQIGQEQIVLSNSSLEPCLLGCLATVISSWQNTIRWSQR